MNLNGILIGSEDPGRLSEYYTMLFGEPGWNEAPNGEFERLKSAGATIVQEPYNPSAAQETLVATFSDPDGNYFQLISPMDMG